MLIDSKIIAVDFDGTIVSDRYPKIGKPLPFAFETLRLLQSEGHRLVLWTVRTGRTLEEAVKFCEENGIQFYAVNKTFAEEDDRGSRKITADLFIDDRNVGGLPQWGEIYQMISGKNELKKASKGWWPF